MGMAGLYTFAEIGNLAETGHRNFITSMGEAHSLVLVTWGTFDPQPAPCIFDTVISRKCQKWSTIEICIAVAPFWSAGFEIYISTTWCVPNGPYTRWASTVLYRSKMSTFTKTGKTTCNDFWKHWQFCLPVWACCWCPVCEGWWKVSTWFSYSLKK